MQAVAGRQKEAASPRSVELPRDLQRQQGPASAGVSLVGSLRQSLEGAAGREAVLHKGESLPLVRVGRVCGFFPLIDYFFSLLSKY